MITSWRSVLRGSTCDVVVCDTDALFGDACDALTHGVRSPILRAIDAGFLVALMSEQAYRELGWVYQKAARGYRVDAEELRRLLESEYLPRIPVVRTPRRDGARAPEIDHVRDPDDRAHAQLARLIAPCTVYSHDKHLRRPGYAPPDRAAYDSRLAQVAAVALYLELQIGAAVGLNLTGVATSAAVRAVLRHSGAARVGVAAVLAAGATAITLALRSPSRRGQIVAALAEMAEAVGALVQDGVAARQALAASPLVQPDLEPALEVRLASLLARRPALTITEMRSGLESEVPPHAVVKAALEGHPSFERDARGHWTLGSVRLALVTPVVEAPTGAHTTEDAGRGRPEAPEDASGV